MGHFPCLRTGTLWQGTLPSGLRLELVLPYLCSAYFGKDLFFSSAASKKSIDAIKRRSSSDRSNRQYRSAASVSVTSAHRPWPGTGNFQHAAPFYRGATPPCNVTHISCANHIQIWANVNFQRSGGQRLYDNNLQSESPPRFIWPGIHYVYPHLFSLHI